MNENFAFSNTGNPKGFMRTWAANYTVQLEDEYGIKLPDLSWGRPVMIPGQDNPFFATDTAGPVEGIASFDIDQRTLRLVKPLSSAARDIAHITDNVLAVALASGAVEITRGFGAGEDDLTTIASAEKKGAISEMAVSANASTIATGDRCGNIFLHDPSSAAIFAHATMDECLSIKTSLTVNGGYNVCTGLETPSKFTVYDPRGTDARLVARSKLGGLLTSSQLDEHHVVWGFETGALHFVDLRRPLVPLLQVQDPYVQAVGHIEFNEDKSMFVVSGLTDYTVYSRDMAGMFRPAASESGSQNVGNNMDGYATNAVFITRSTIFCTNSKAGVSLNEM